MVRPERFELPAFWFVARRSIQLSYGRTRAVSSETIDRLSGILRRRNWMKAALGPQSCRRRGYRCRGGEKQRQFLSYLQACLAHELGNSGGVEAGCVVLDAQGAGGSIEA